MPLADLIKKFPSQENLSFKPRPYINHSIKLKKPVTSKERAEMMDSIGLNVFFFPSEMVSGCDFLSDSGTTTMTNEQWASLHLGDEAYGSNEGYFVLMNQIRETFGTEFFSAPETGNPNAFIFHQGRPAEHALFTVLGKTGKNLIIPSNGHFDTTEANIKSNKIHAVNLFSKELKCRESDSCFKGNMDLERLKELLEKNSSKIPVVYMTLTNNTGGGQPASMENIKAVSEMAHKFSLPFFFDACRFAENAWFIKKNEKGFAGKKISEIVKEMFSFADGFTISFKKDGLVNMGGGLFLKEKGLFMKKFPAMPNQLMDSQILSEGHPTYGGMNGRDLMALAKGLETITKEEYLTHRIEQVNDFGKKMDKEGIPMLTPFGGHAVYMDVNKFFADTKMKPNDFGGIAFTALLLSAYGHRACELGYFAFGSYDAKTGMEKFPEVNFVRFAVPRLMYEKQDLDAAAEAVKALFEERHKIPGVEATYGKELTLRHFKARFRFKK